MWCGGGIFMLSWVYQLSGIVAISKLHDRGGIAT